MMRLFLLILFSSLLGLSNASAAEKVWSALIYASNEKSPASPAAPLEPYAGKLRKIFGYNHFEILNEHQQEMTDQSEKWFLPGNPFCLTVKAKEKKGGTYHLKLKLFQEKNLLVKTEAALCRRSPIFIRGPLYAKGHLILALLVE